MTLEGDLPQGQQFDVAPGDPQPRVYSFGQEFPAVENGTSDFTIVGVGKGYVLFSDSVISESEDPTYNMNPKIVTRDATGKVVLRDLPFSVEPEIEYFDPSTAEPNITCHVRLEDLRLSAPNHSVEDKDDDIALFIDWKTPEGERIEFNVFEEDKSNLWIRFEQEQPQMGGISSPPSLNDSANSPSDVTQPVEGLDPEVEQAIREYAGGDPEEEQRLREDAKTSWILRESLRHPGQFTLSSSSPDFSNLDRNKEPKE